MSAELYDAEMAGALARPAIDVLPSSHTRKDKHAEPVDAPVEVDSEVAAPALAADPIAPDAFASPSDADLVAPSAPDAGAELVEEASIAPEAVAAPAPRKVFGMTLTRGRKPKGGEAPEVEASVDSAVDAVVEDEAVAASTESADAAVAAEAAPLEIVALAPAMPDHTEEVRAMRALLEASEQVRQAAEARTSAAESQLRTVTNTVQEWQIRHREAESTITELAGSLASAEGRMAELHQQLSTISAERDELVSQLDAATSPATS